MRKSAYQKLALAAATVASAVASATAQNAFINGVPTLDTVQLRSGIWGFAFEVGDRDITVDQLGFYDQNNDGLAGTHRVGIWLASALVNPSSNNLVGFGTLTAGTGDTLDNQYRWTSTLAAPITLLAGQRYIIGAENSAAVGFGLDQVDVSPKIQNWGLNTGLASGPLTRRDARVDGGSWPNSNTVVRDLYGVNASDTAPNAKSTVINANVWTGGSGSHWNSATNWGGSLPAFGGTRTQLAFGAATPATVNNDVTNASLRGIRFDSGAPAVTVTGNGFTLNGSISNLSSNTQTLNTGQINAGQGFINAAGGNIVIASPVNVGNGNSASPLIIVGSKNVTISGNLSGSSPLTHAGTGVATLSGNNSAFTGSININANQGAFSVNPRTGVAPQLVVSNSSNLGASSVVVTTGIAGAGLKLSGSSTYNQTVVLPSRGTFQTAGFSQFPQLQSDGNNTWSGPITLNGGANNHIIESSSGTFNITSDLSPAASGAHTVYLQGSGNGQLSGGLADGSGQLLLIKTGSGTWKINGAQAPTYTGTTRVWQGTLDLDYTTNNNSHLGSGQLALRGGTLKVTGNNSSNTVQNVGSTAIDQNGASTITINNGSGATATLGLGALTRFAGTSVDINGTGVVNVAGSVTNTNGILGAYATRNGGAGWATVDGSNNLVPYAAYTNDTWASGNNTDITTSAAVTGATTNSVRFNAAAANTITLNGANTISSGGILVTPSVGANMTTITGSGSLASGLSNELIVSQNNTAGSLTISTTLAPATVLTKTGAGVLVLSNTGTFTGNTHLIDGKIVVTTADALKGSQVNLWRDNALVFQGLTSVNIGAIAGSGALNLGSTDLYLSTNAAPQYDGNISGTGNIYFRGGATNTRFVGNNSAWDGNLYIENGRLSINSPQALGSTVGKTICTGNLATIGGFNSAGEIYFRGGLNAEFDEDITILGRGYNGTGSSAFGEGGLRLDNNTNIKLNTALKLAADPTATRAGIGAVTETLISLGNNASLELAGGVQGASGLPNQNLILFTNGDSGGHLTNPPNSTGKISGNVNLGTGTLTVDGQWIVSGASNTWGATYVTVAGNLQVGDGGSTGSLGTGPVVLGASTVITTAPPSYAYASNVVFNRTGTLNVTNDISGAGGVHLYGDGTVVLTGNNSFSNPLLLANGTAQFASDGNIGSASSIQFVSNGGTLRTTGAVNSGKVLAIDQLATASVDTNGLSSTFGNVVGASGTLRKVGAGTLTVGNVTVAAMNVDAGRLRITPGSGTSATNAVSIANNAQLDLENNRLQIAYSGSSPLTTLVGQLKTGHNGGAWNGSSASSGAIVSSTAASDVANIATNGRRALGIGEGATVGAPAGTVLIRYTYTGDANLDGMVDSIDFNTTLGDASNYGLTSGAIWTQGDFNYDGKVNTLDMNELAGNFGRSAPAPLPGPSLGAVVPEPASIGLLAFGLAGVAMRRRKTR